MYGLAARAVRISADGLTYRFLLRPEARFHDGTPLTAQDVAFSLDDAEGEGPSDHHAAPARFRRLRGGRRRDRDRALCAEARARRAAVRRRRCRSSRAPITASGRSTKSTLDIPLGCGPYKVGRFEAGRYHRIQARHGLVGRRSAGRRAARTISTRVRYEYYRDRDVGFEGFTAKSYLFREEFTSRIWATRYDFPGDQGRPRQARRAARRHAVGRAGLVHQHAAGEIQESASCARR